MSLKPKARILVVDDEAVNLKLIAEILKEEYELAFAKSGEEALQLTNTQPDLILLDIMMPGMDGFEVAQKLKRDGKTQNIPIIFVSAMNETVDEVKGLDLGAVDYITKPINSQVVRLRVNTQIKLLQIQRALQQQNNSLESAVADRTQELQEAQIEMVKRMGLLAEYRDPETGDHIERMSRYAEALASAMGLDQAQCELIRMASPMHDIGKVGIPDRILIKPGKLTPEEWRTMQAHSLIGATILTGGRSQLLKTAHLIAAHHHEKYDGSGYPMGLAGEDIPIEGRIAAIADVFDALSSKRPYKEPWPLERVLDLLKEEKGRHFDPKLVDLFLSILDKIIEIKDQHPN
ncbi:MAG: two-component system response regulator [bacterium]|nr:two-component system response regulator [bacterium]